MRKLFAMLLALAMLFALVACAGGGSGGGNQAPAETGNWRGGKDIEDISQFANQIGMFFDEVDPHSRRTYDIVYAYNFPMALYQVMYEALLELEPVFNFNTIMYFSNADNEAMAQNIEIFAAQGVDGFIINIDVLAQDRIVEVLNSTNLPYIALFSAVRDSNGGNIVPIIGLDGIDCGEKMTQDLYDRIPSHWGDIDKSKIGLLNYDFSPNFDFTTRYLGAKARFEELIPNNAGIFTADGVVGARDEQTGYDLAAAILAANPEIEYWFIVACLELYGLGAARAVEHLGIEDRVLITAAAADVLMSQWDAGYDGPWVSAAATDRFQWMAPVISGMISLINGTSTWETLWAYRRAPGDTYTFYGAPITFVTIDTYQGFPASVRPYTGLPPLP